MRKYKIKFSGRKKGAIGVFEPFEVEIEAKDRNEATLKLYNGFEHVQPGATIQRLLMNGLPNGKVIDFFV